MFVGKWTTLVTNYVNKFMVGKEVQEIIDN
jgi:hypothetical protein